MSSKIYIKQEFREVIRNLEELKEKAPKKYEEIKKEILTECDKKN